MAKEYKYFSGNGVGTGTRLVLYTASYGKMSTVIFNYVNLSNLGSGITGAIQVDGFDMVNVTGSSNSRQIIVGSQVSDGGAAAAASIMIPEYFSFAKDFGSAIFAARTTWMIGPGATVAFSGNGSCQLSYSFAVIEEY